MRYLLPLTFVIAVVSCTPDGWPRTESSSAFDIVTAEGSGLWSAEESWRAVDHLRIGQQNGPTEYTFVWIQAIEVDGEGRIYVLDPGSYGVKVYSAGGNFVHAFGRQGGGPGEFANKWGIVGLVLLDEDRVGVYDFLMKKLAVFAPNGKTSSVPLSVGRRPLGQTPVSLTTFPDAEHFLVHTIQGFSVPRQQDGENSQMLMRIDVRQAVSDTLFTFPGIEATTYVDGRRPLVFPKPLGRSWRWSAGPGGQIAFGSSASYEITITDANGKPISTLKRHDIDRRVTDDEKALLAAAYPWGDGTDAFEPDLKRAAENALAALEWPDTWPAFDRLVFDTAGRLWVRLPIPPGVGSHDWHVYDVDLDFLGVVSTPEGFEVFKITDQFIYGREVDDLDVHNVVVLRIEKPEVE